MTVDDLSSHVRIMRTLGKDAQRKYLQRLIGPPTDAPRTLDFRARLISELSKAGIWPPRAKES